MQWHEKLSLHRMGIFLRTQFCLVTCVFGEMGPSYERIVELQYVRSFATILH